MRVGLELVLRAYVDERGALRRADQSKQFVDWRGASLLLLGAERDASALRLMGRSRIPMKG